MKTREDLLEVAQAARAGSSVDDVLKILEFDGTKLNAATIQVIKTVHSLINASTIAFNVDERNNIADWLNYADQEMLREYFKMVDHPRAEKVFMFMCMNTLDWDSAVTLIKNAILKIKFEQMYATAEQQLGEIVIKLHEQTQETEIKYLAEKEAREQLELENKALKNSLNEMGIQMQKTLRARRVAGAWRELWKKIAEFEEELEEEGMGYPVDISDGAIG